MIAQKFEIKVALLGHVSVGKTTVLNALFQDKYSEVSMRRTTAGINFFRVAARQNKCKQTESTEWQNKSKTPRTEDEMDTDEEFILPDEVEAFKGAPETLQAIQADNSVLRTKNAIQEKVFDVLVDKHFFKMRPDTKLVLVDIPGVNEAGSSKMYLDYVTKVWDTFDCVVVVMDASQGVNTEEQVKLLEFVKKNLTNKKEVPVIVLCNKVDDPDDEEVAVLVDEVRAKVQHIFFTDCRKQVLDKIMKTKSSIPKVAWPVFIPISAGNAFVYRTAARLSLDEFKTLDKEYIDKIGRDEVGRFKWKKFSEEKKYEVTYKAVSNPDQYIERLEATNFDKFLRVLSLSVGGQRAQEELIGKQIEVALQHLTTEDWIADQLCAVYDRSKVLGKPTGHLKTKFWELYSQCEKDAFKALSMDMNGYKLHAAMEQLIRYARGHHYWRNDGTGATVHASKNCKPAGRAFSEWTPIGPGKWKEQSSGNIKNCKEHPSLKKLHWNNISPHDARTIVGSILLLSYNKHFCEELGKEKMMLERVMLEGNFNKYLGPCACSLMPDEQKMKTTLDDFTRGGYGEGGFVPDDPTKYKYIVRLEVPDSPSNPKHFGHLIWKYCQFMKSRNKDA